MKRYIIIVFALLAIFIIPERSEAANCGGATECHCGDTVTSSYTLTGDITAIGGGICTGNGLVVGAPSITIDGNGYSLTGTSGNFVLGSGMIGVVNSAGHDSVTIEDLTITNFTTGIDFRNSSGSTLRNNVIVTEYCVSGTGGCGKGIYLDSSPNLTITGNTINLPTGRNAAIGIDIYSSNTGTISNNSVYHSSNGISLANTSGVNISGNTIEQTTWAIYTNSYNDASITDNAIRYNSDAGYLGFTAQETPSLTLSGNTFVGNGNPVSASDGKNLSFASNNFTYEATSTMAAIGTTDRTIDVGATASFEITLKDPNGAACNTCTAAVWTNPAEIISYSKTGNVVTGSFVPTKSGAYSLTAEVTDSGGNITKTNFMYFVGDLSTIVTKYYSRSEMPFNGSPYGSDAKALLFTPPSQTEEWECSYWTQNSPDTLPYFPISNLASINIHGEYYMILEEGFTCGEADDPENAILACYVAVERFTTYTASYDSKVAIEGYAEYTDIDQSFTNLNWSLDAPTNWHWISTKIYGWMPFFRTTVADPSYVEFTQQYPTDVKLKSASNKYVYVLSSTATTSDITIVLDNVLATATTTDIVLASSTRPFLNATSTIGSDATTTTTFSVSGNASTSFATVDMDITPSADEVAVRITTWNTGGDYSKEWTETSDTSDVTTVHTVGDLAADTAYTVSVGGTSYGSYLSNASGQISFTYSGGYSTKMFSIAATDAPTVTSGTATGLTATAATLAGEVTATGGGNATEHGFAWGTSADLSSAATTTGGSFLGTGAFSESSAVSLSSLTCNTAYYFRAYATNLAGTGYGDIATFTTSACPVSNSGSSPSSSFGSRRHDLASIWSVPSSATSAPIVVSAPLRFVRDLEVGSTGPDVRDLQAFLNSNGFPISLSGPGSYGNETDYFGLLTKRALISFQESNAISILSPYGMTRGTGQLGPSTRAFINARFASLPASQIAQPNSSSSPTFARDLQVGSTGEDVRRLQIFLNGRGYRVAFSGLGSSGQETMLFGAATRRSLIEFQSANGISPTGYFGPITRAKVIQLLKQ